MPRLALLLIAVLLCACAGAPVPPPNAALQQRAATAGLALPPGFSAERTVSGLHRPTALAFGPDGLLYITQLNGDEGSGQGQVVVIDGPGAAPRVVLDGLFKPTGLAWRGEELFIAAGRDLLQTRYSSDGLLAPPTLVVGDLPFNTRSEGQLDLLPSGQLLFEASGLVTDPQSGVLLTLVPGEAPVVLATGLKNAYGHALDPESGQLYTTEIGDDPVDGQAPPDEINAVQAGGDYGWPRCYADRIPASDRGATTASCAATQAPIITFAPHSSPTGLVFYDGEDFPPAYRKQLYVALWNGAPPTVQRVTLATVAGSVGTATPFIGGLGRPIDLAQDPQGGLLVLDYEGDALYRISADAL